GRHSELAKSAIVYTRHGFHLVWRLPERTVLEPAQQIARRIHRALADCDIEIDRGTTDWTRLFQCPFAEKGLGLVPDLEGFDPIAIDALPEVATRPARPAPRVKAARGAGPMPDDFPGMDALPNDLRSYAVRIAEAMRVVTHDWHRLALALAGALVRH